MPKLRGECAPGDHSQSERLREALNQRGDAAQGQGEQEEAGEWRAGEDALRAPRSCEQTYGGLFCRGQWRRCAPVMLTEWGVAWPSTHHRKAKTLTCILPKKLLAPVLLPPGQVLSHSKLRPNTREIFVLKVERKKQTQRDKKKKEGREAGGEKERGKGGKNGQFGIKRLLLG